jgi:CDP-4-dehydro-6-deoxyglucose reductase
MHIISLASGKSFASNEGVSILESSIGSTVSLPYSCKTGRCSTCKCKVIEGTAKLLDAEIGLTEEEKSEGWILSCVREAQTNLTLEIEDLGDIALPPSKTYPCRISSIEKLASDVIRVMLRLPPSSDFHFIPGQYIDVIGPHSIRRSYSLANSSFAEKLVELHIRSVNGGAMSDYWFNHAKTNDLLRFNGPLGTFFLRPSIADRDLIFLATGTGIAPVKSILESLKNNPLHMQPKSVNVYWGGRKAEDLYFKFQNFEGNFRFVPVLSRVNSEWMGARGYVHMAALSSHSNFEKATVYACGSSAMIQSAKTVLINAGLPVDHFYSDAFVCSAKN